MRNVPGWAAAAFTAWYIIEEPANAGRTLGGILAFLALAAHALGVFVTSVH